MRAEKENVEQKGIKREEEEDERRNVCFENTFIGGKSGFYCSYIVYGIRR